MNELQAAKAVPRIELVSRAVNELAHELTLAVEDGYEIETLMEHVVSRFDNTQRAAFLLQCLSSPDEMTREEKAFAVEVADHIGPDFAQKLYHFAVLVTKLA